jgi:diguanylate cyclase (GGDEF)-like protein
LHNYFGGVDPYRYCLFFMVAYVWIGLSQPRWTSLRVAPITVIAYLAPLLISHRPAVALISVVYALPVFVLVGESIAWVGTQLQSAQRSLAHQAFHDPLTGLANRALFTDRVEHATELHRRDMRPVTVLFLDLDDFKAVNDTYGHAGGDALLRAVAERLRGALRPADTLARLGGDEFAVLLESPIDDPATVGGRVLAALETPFAIGDDLVRVTSSIGVVTASAGTALADGAALLQRADAAMYAAKAAGKHTMRVDVDDNAPDSAARIAQ